MTNQPNLTCQDERRREEVRRDNDLNGLDYVEVSEDRHTLTVYFLDKAPKGLKKVNLSIEGGRRIRDINVVDFEVYREDDPSLDDWMKVDLDKVGDFSDYALRLVEESDRSRPMRGFDPRYASVVFRFDDSCPSDLDCKSRTICPPPERDEPEISYLAKDYASFRQLILDRLSLIMPGWQERHVPDLGIALAEALAYVADHLSYYQDAVATEAYLHTARRRISVRRHVRLVDYLMHEGCNARTWVCVKTDTDLPPLDPADIAFVTGHDGAPATSTTITFDDLRTVPRSRYEVFEPLVEERVLLRIRDLLDPAGLAKKLWNPDSSNQLSRSLWDRFSDRTRRLLTEYVDSGEASASLESALVDELNRLIQSDDLYDEQRVPDGTVGEAQAFGEQRPRGEDLMRRNRWLLEKEYSAEIARTKAIYHYEAHSEIPFYTWGDEECCLPWGATRATLRDQWIAEPAGKSSDGAAYEQTAQQSQTQQQDKQPEVKQYPPTQGPLRRRLRHLEEGDILIFEEVVGPETGNPADADRAHRHAVRLTRVEPGLDPLLKELIPGTDRKEPIPIVEIEWAPEDELPFPLCLSTIGPPPACELLENVSVARGNVILVDHGETVGPEDLGTVPEAETIARCGDRCHPAETVTTAARFRPPPLAADPLTFSEPLPAHSPACKLLDQDPHKARPQVIQLVGSHVEYDRLVDTYWTAQRDLLASQGHDPHFIVEMDDERRAHLRFGDGELGRMPQAATRFRATYRVGSGPSGNVGAETITRIAFRRRTVSGAELRVRNPLPAQGGIPPESLAEARLFAPHAFSTELQRAITADDYARLAERHRDVQRAAATLRWTGGWYEVLVAIDPRGGVAADDRLLAEIQRHLCRYRRMSHDLRVTWARYVPLEITMKICVRADFLRGQVKATLLDVFSNRILPDGRLGFFHPDNLTFGDDIFLSPLVATALAVPGVESAAVTKLKRYFEEPNGEIENGVLELGPLEVGRVDSDPDFPENGVFRLEMEGGR